MKKTMVMVLLIASIFLCSCANKQLPANSSPESNEAKAQLEENTNSMATEPTPMSAWMLKAHLIHKTASILRLRTSYRRSRHLLEFLSVFGTISRRCFIASLFLNPTPNVTSNEKQIPLTKNKVSWSGISLRTYSPLQEHGTKIFYLICPGKRQRLSQTEWYMILCQAIS